MRKFKKAVSLLIVFAMTMTMCAVSVNVGAEGATEITLNEFDYSIAAKLDELDVVDVVEDQNLANIATRGSMIPILMKYLLIDGTSIEGTTTPFLDVSFSDDNIESYRVLYKSGYIKGDENKKFRPNDSLTYNEAVTFIINAMGYRPFADRNGGYPAGYLYTANKYGLLDGLRGSGTDPIPFCDLYRIIDASLFADAVVYRFTADEDDTAFELRSDITVLEELHGYSYVQGIVTGNKNTKLLESGSNIKENEIEIGNVKYETPGKDYTDLLGRLVNAYSKKGEFGRTNLIYVEPSAKVNKEYTVSSTDILRDEVTGTKLFYKDENGKKKFFAVDNVNISVIYNGKSRTGYGQLKNVMPASGKVVGVDNTGDGAIDVLFVYDYTNILVGSVDSTSYRVYDKITNSYITLNSDNDIIYIYNSNNEQVGLDAITQGCVLSVMESVNTGKKMKTAYIVNSLVEGSVSEITDNKYVINGEYYKTAANLETYIASYGVSPISVGTQGNFLLDYQGNIAYYEKTAATDINYGVLAAMEWEDGRIENTIEFKIFTQKGSWLDAAVAKKLTLNGAKLEKDNDTHLSTIVSALDGDTEISDMLDATEDGVIRSTAGIGWVILYKTNANGEITYIDTAERDAAEGELNLVTAGLKMFRRGGVANNKNYVAGGGTEAVPQDFFYDGGSPIIFKIPETADMMEDTDKFKVIKSLSGNYYDADQSGDNKITNGFAAYSIGNNSSISIPTCIILRGSADLGSIGLNSDRDLRIVTKITTAVNEDGESVKKLYYIRNGEEVGTIVNSTVSYHYTKVEQTYKEHTNKIQQNTAFESIGLQPGDVIRLDKDEDGYINFIHVIYRKTGGTASNSVLPSGTGSTYVTTYTESTHDGVGYVTAVEVDVANRLVAYNYQERLTSFSAGENIYSTENGTMISKAVSNAPVLIYYKGTGLYEKAGLEAIVPGDKLIINSKTSHMAEIDDLIIYRN